MKPRLLDAFCGAGGCTKGYQRAGFYVVGVDIKPQPNYCGDDFIRVDALRYLGEYADRGVSWDFDAIHASPPCHASSSMRFMWNAGEYVDLIAPTRELLIEAGLPYVIENVEGSKLVNPIRLCGSSFGLGADGRELRRHRRFECSFPVMAPPCQHSKPVVGVYGTGGGGQMTRGFKARSREEAGDAMGIDWMTKAELAQAIPPAMTEHIGEFLMAEIKRAKGCRMTLPSSHEVPR